MHEVASNGHHDLVAPLVKAGADVSPADREGRTPLHEAAARGLGRVVIELLGSGARVDAVTADGRTALHEAAANGDLGTVGSLAVRHRPSLAAVDRAGRTPVDVASCEEVAHYLRRLQSPSW